MDQLTAVESDSAVSEINPTGWSRIARTDGSTTLVGPEFAAEIFATNPLPLYEVLAHAGKVAVAQAAEDQVIGKVNLDNLGEGVKRIVIAGANHDFDGAARAQLLSFVQNELGA